MKLIIFMVLLSVVLCMTEGRHNNKKRDVVGSSGAKGHAHFAGNAAAVHQGALTKNGGSHHSAHEEGNKGQHDKQLQKSKFEEGSGKHHTINSEGHHGQTAHSENGGSHGAKFAQADKQKKTGYMKGFHKQYRKDEAHKLDGHYSSRHQTGEYKKFGQGHSQKHASAHKAHSKNKENKKAALKHKAQKGEFKTHKSHKGHIEKYSSKHV